MPTPNSAHIENTNFTPLRKKLITGDQWIKTREKVTKNKIKKLQTQKTKEEYLKIKLTLGSN
jgi:hypothetical protein